MLEFVDAMLDYDKDIRILGEMKPNEPMDLMYMPTTGHFLALAYKTKDPSRVGVLIESAHAILAGLDPSDEFANAIFHGKLWGVHLNDQNGLKYDQDKAFGAVDLRRAFNQVERPGPPRLRQAGRSRRPGRQGDAHPAGRECPPAPQALEGNLPRCWSTWFTRSTARHGKGTSMPAITKGWSCSSSRT